MSHPAIQDGITDDEAKIVATLYGASPYGPGLVNTALGLGQSQFGGESHSTCRLQGRYCWQ